MKANFMRDIKSSLEKIDQIKNILYIYDRGIKFKYCMELNNHNFVLGVDNIENSDALVDQIKTEQEVLFSSKKDKIYNEIQYKTYKQVYYNGKSVCFDLVNQENLDGFLNKFNNIEIIKDSDKISQNHIKEKRDKVFWKVPDQDQLETKANKYFEDILDAALYYSSGDKLKANLIYDHLVKKLVFTCNNYLSLKYKNSIYLDKRGRNLKTYLDNEYYDGLIEVSSMEKNEKFWTGLFKIARLYRQISLLILEQKKFNYPKEEDVKLMSYLRDLYKGEISE